MKKIFLIMLFVCVFLTGCNNKEEKEKNEYLAMKSNLLETKKYTSKEELQCDILVNIDRHGQEKVVYKVTLFNPKENMNNIKAIVVHNYYTEDVFPTIGLFDEKATLKTDSEKEENLTLSGVIETTDNIDKIGLQLKILIEYTTDNGEVKDIYYKTT